MDINIASKNNLIESDSALKSKLISQLSPTILYDNSAGTTGTVTLSQPITDFSYLEIIYGKLENGSCGYNSIKIPATTGTKCIMEHHDINGTLQFMCSTLNVTASSIKWTRNAAHFNISTSTGTWSSWNNAGVDCKIFKVYGFKKLVIGKLNQ